MGGRRGVYDQLVAGGLAGESGDLQPGDQLVGAGKVESEEALHVFVVQIGPARGDGAELLAVLGGPAVQGRQRGQLHGEQLAFAGRDLSGLVRQRDVEDVAQRRGWIGGDGEDAAAGFSGGEGGGRGAGGLAHAALASEKLQGRKRISLRRGLRGR